LIFGRRLHSWRTNAMLQCQMLLRLHLSLRG
jgi:hypothetical protein